MLRSYRGFGHVVARIGTALTRVGTETHLLAVRKSLAGGLALLTHLGTDRARVSMKVGSAKHEVGAGLAHFRAIHQEADVGSFEHFAALGEAMGDGEHADAMAVATVLDALLHVMSCRVRDDHWTSVAVW